MISGDDRRLSYFFVHVVHVNSDYAKRKNGKVYIEISFRHIHITKILVDLIAKAGETHLK